MSHESNIIAAIDIGTTKIVAMIGRKNEYGKLEILGLGKAKSLGVHRGVVSCWDCESGVDLGLDGLLAVIHSRSIGHIDDRLA